MIDIVASSFAWIWSGMKHRRQSMLRETWAGTVPANRHCGGAHLTKEIQRSWEVCVCVGQKILCCVLCCASLHSTRAHNSLPSFSSLSSFSHSPLSLSLFYLSLLSLLFSLPLSPLFSSVSLLSLFNSHCHHCLRSVGHALAHRVTCGLLCVLFWCRGDLVSSRECNPTPSPLESPLPLHSPPPSPPIHPSMSWDPRHTP